MQTTDGLRLTRRRHDRVIAGVCGGIADQFGIDVTLVRVAAVALAVFGGAGFLLYAVGWAMIPEEGSRRSHAEAWMRHGRWQPILGIVLIAIAVSSFGQHLWHLGDVGFPLFLIGLGAFLLWFRPPEPGPTGPRDAPPVEPTPTTPFDPTTPADPTIPLPADTLIPPPPPPPSTPPPPAAPWREDVVDWRRESRDRRGQALRARRDRRRQRRSLTVPTIGLLSIGAGVVGLALAAGRSIDAPSVFAGALVAVGAALVAGTWFGRAGGLIPFGLVLLAALSATAALHIPFEGGVGERRFHPASVRELDAAYHLSIGQLEVDLRNVHPESGSTEHIDMSVGIGQLLVKVPSDVEVIIHGHTELGDLKLGATDDGGWRVDEDTTRPGREGAGRIEIDAQVGIGQVEVRDA